MTLEDIKTEVEQLTNIPDISVKSRERNYVIARGIYCYLAEKNTVSTYQKIGQFIGRDHSTILYSIKTLETHLMYEPFFKSVFDELSAKFRGERLKAVENHQDKEKMYRLLNEIPERKYKTVIRLLEAV